MKIIAESCLDEATAAAFLSFVRQEQQELIRPEEILQAKDFAPVTARIEGLVNRRDKRLDILSVIATLLVNFLLKDKKEKWDKTALKNVEGFILLDLVPNDLRLSVAQVAQDLVRSENASLKALVAVPAIGRLILSKM